MLIVCGCWFETCQQQQINLSKKFGYYSIISKAALEDLQERKGMWCRLADWRRRQYINKYHKCQDQLCLFPSKFADEWRSLIYVDGGGKKHSDFFDLYLKFETLFAKLPLISRICFICGKLNMGILLEMRPRFLRRDDSHFVLHLPHQVVLLGHLPGKVSAVQEIYNNVCDDNKLERSNHIEK